MPQLSKILPKYRKHSSGQARVSINGRDYLLGPYGTKASKRGYDRLIAEYLASGRSAAFGVHVEAYTMAMVMDDYPRFSRFPFSSSTSIHRLFSRRFHSPR